MTGVSTNTLIDKTLKFKSSSTSKAWRKTSLSLFSPPPPKKANHALPKMSDSESETGVPLQEPLSPSTTPEAGTSRPANKRKRAASEEPALEALSDSDAAPATAATTTQTESKRAAKKRKQKNKKPKDVAREEALDVELGVNHALKHMDGQLLADHIAQRVKKFEGEKLSGVEEDDLKVPGQLFSFPALNAVVDSGRERGDEDKMHITRTLARSRRRSSSSRSRRRRRRK